MIAFDYLVMDDAHYVESDEMGALLGADGIRAVMQRAYQEQCSLMHVHRHEHAGTPEFSRVDARENAKLIPSFWNVAPAQPHGAIVLSFDRATAQVWDPVDRKPHPVNSIQIIGLRIEEVNA